MAAYDLFINKAEDYTFNIGNRELANNSKRDTYKFIDNANKHFVNIDLAKTRANVYRRKTIDILDKLLVDFETEFSRKGGTVVWINNEKEAHTELVKIIQKENNTSAFLATSDIANELKLEVGLNKEKISIFGQEPYNVAIAQANFICVEGGVAAIASNDFKANRIFAQAKTQIILVGIESITQTFNELDLLLQLQTFYKTGNETYDCSQFISGANINVYVFLVDNGRSNLLNNQWQKNALNCIQCNACVNVCNVSVNAGKKNYDTVYAGPIGSIVSPQLFIEEDYSHLYFASLLDGEAEKVCPVKIDFSSLLLQKRNTFIKSGLASKKDNISYYFWKNAMLKRSTMEKGGAKFKNFMLRQFFKKGWGNRREFPAVADKSFNQLWRERKGIK